MPLGTTKPIFDHHANNKSSFWKRSNRKNRTKRFAKVFIFIIIIFALVNFLIKIPGWFQNTNRPFEQIQTESALNGVVNSDIRTNILLVSISDSNNIQDLALASFNSDKSSLTIVNIPVSPKTYLAASDQNISLAATYFSKLYLDSEFDSLYIATQETLALPIDGYFAFFTNDFEFTEEKIEETKNNLSFFSLTTNLLGYKSWLNENMKTNYSVSSIFGLILELRQINKEKIVFVSLSEAIEDKHFIFSKVDNIIRDSMLDTAITKEAAVVEIVNGGYSSQLIKRLVNNLGASTLNIGLDDQKKEIKVIQNSDKEILAKRLARFLEVNVEKGDNQGGSDVKVLIGSDFEANFYGK